jgi:predicted dehydrogenase
MKRLNVALIGCGWVADWHVAGGLDQWPDRFALVAACDTNPERLRAWADKYAIERRVERYDDVLAMADIDVVIICTPPSLHCEMVAKALRAGKHAVCEKPFARSLAEVDEIARTEREGKARVMPIFQYRFGDGIARVKHVIDRGLAGRHFVTSVETAKRRGADYYAVPWRGKFATELGGVLLTQAIHIHDLLLWLVGPATEASCFKTTRVNPIEVEDCAVGMLRLADGSLASLSANLGSARQLTRLRLCFEHVTFEKQCFDDDSAKPGNEPWLTIPKNADAGAAIAAAMAEVPPRTAWFARQYELFHDALATGAPFPVTLADARASLELITALFDSDRTGRSVPLPITAAHPLYGGWVPQQREPGGNRDAA